MYMKEVFILNFEALIFKLTEVVTNIIINLLIIQQMLNNNKIFKNQETFRRL